MLRSQSYIATPPGATIAEQLDDKGIGQKKFAVKMDMSEELAEELIKYDKVKNEEQIKALADFLEYLFLIQDKELENKYEEYKRERGGAVRMTVDQIRQKYYEQKGIEEGVKKTAINLLKMGMSESIVAEGTGLTIDEVKELKKQIMN